jgi:uncharacterized protein (DUF169 family)
MMGWKGYADTLKSVLNLKGSPIAVTYSMEPNPRGKEGRHWVCHALQKAREGEIFSLSRETSSCGGGTFHLGLGPRPTGEADKALKEFLIRGEKLFCSLASLQRVRSLSLTPPLGLADHVHIAPLEAAEERPDLVIFLVDAEQACRLLTLATFMDGIPPKMQLMGSACYMTITYPLISGEINLSLLDYTARRMRRFAPEELCLTIPFHKMQNLIQSIPLCSAGTAEIEIPAAFRRYMSEGFEQSEREKESGNGQEMAR